MLRPILARSLRYEANDYCGADHRDGQHGAEGHVRCGGVGKADHADGGGKQKQQPARGFCTVNAPREPGHCQRGEPGGNRAGQARRGFTYAEKLEANRRAPIIKWRLLEPWPAVEPRRDPVAGFGHVARNPSVAWLVGTDKSDSAEMTEIADVQRRANQRGPADTRCKCVRVLARSNVSGGGHGRVSLALVRVNVSA